MLDEKVRAVLERLEAEDAREREEGVARELRARQVARSTGQFLFALVAPQWDCEVLEIGGSRGYSSIWLGAGVRHIGGRVLSLEIAELACHGNVLDIGSHVDRVHPCAANGRERTGGYCDDEIPAAGHGGRLPCATLTDTI